MASEWKQEYLDNKYSYVDGEQENRHKSLKRKHKAKVPRSNHKHDYKNCIFVSNETVYSKRVTQYTLGSYCTICGKVGFYTKDEHYIKAKKKNPNVSTFFWAHPSVKDKDKDNFSWAFDAYEIFECNPFTTKFLEDFKK